MRATGSTSLAGTTWSCGGTSGGYRSLTCPRVAIPHKDTLRRRCQSLQFQSLVATASRSAPRAQEPIQTSSRTLRDAGGEARSRCCQLFGWVGARVWGPHRVGSKHVPIRDAMGCDVIWWVGGCPFEPNPRRGRRINRYFSSSLLPRVLSFLFPSFLLFQT